MNLFDKRLDVLEAIIIAVKLYVGNIDNEELDFVEYPNIPYVRDLVRKIDVQKYPELIDYVKDIVDCAHYTNLYLYFDNSFNFNADVAKSVFETKKCDSFARLVRKIYFNENIEEVFSKYHDYLEQYEREYLNLHNFDCEKTRKAFSTLFDVPENTQFLYNISLLINGGFSANKENKTCYVKGIGNNIEANKEKNEYITVCLYHEFAHYFVNPLVDEFFTDEAVVEKLYNESIENGLPNTYSQNKLTVVYEYFVRALSIIFSKKEVSDKEIEEDIDWFKSTGFIRIEEIINFIEFGININENFKNILLDYMEMLKTKFNKRIK